MAYCTVVVEWGGVNEVVWQAPAYRSPPLFPPLQPADHEIKVKNLRMANGSGYIYNYDTVRDVLDDKELVSRWPREAEPCSKVAGRVCGVCRVTSLPRMG